MKRLVYYFEDYGPGNTDAVIEAVEKRLWEGGVSALVVASTTGTTALKFAERVGPLHVPVVCVSDPPSAKSYPGVSEAVRDQLRGRGVTLVDRVPYASASISWQARDNIYGALDLRVVVFDAFRLVGGNGLKVAIEVGLMATDGGHLPPGERICTVGGTGGGADTAIVMKSAFSQSLFSEEPADRPEVYEILAMPMVKKWWW